MEGPEALFGLIEGKQAAHHGFCQDLPVLDATNSPEELARKHGDVSGQCHADSQQGRQAEGRFGIDAKRDDAPPGRGQVDREGNR